MSMCRARAAWRTHASVWNGCCSILSGALAAVERLAPHAIPAGPGTDVARYAPTVSVFNGSIVVVAGGARGSVVLKDGVWRLGPHLPGELFEDGSTIPHACAAVARV